MALKDDADNWVFEDDALRNLVSNFYSSLFTTFGIINVDFPTGCSFPTIFSQDLEFLDRDVSIEETKQALFSMQNLKSPGPDGFHPLFFKSQWEVLGPSIYDFVSSCFADPRNIQGVNHTLLTLLPKCDDPSYVTHFRPIALCNVIYKIVTKVITNVFVILCRML